MIYWVLNSSVHQIRKGKCFPLRQHETKHEVFLICDKSNETYWRGKYVANTCFTPQRRLVFKLELHVCESVCGVFIVVCEHLPPQICSRISAPLPPLIITTCLECIRVSPKGHFELSICVDKAMWGERFWATFAPLDLSNLAPSLTFNP